MLREKGNIPVYFLILLMIGLFVGGVYFGRQTLMQDAQKSRTLDPSPIASLDKEIMASASAVPSASAKPVATQTAVKKVPYEVKTTNNTYTYIDNNRGFSFRFSPTLSLGQISANADLVQFLEPQEGAGKVVRMTVRVYDNETRSLEDLVKDTQIIPQYHQDLGLTQEKLTVRFHQTMKLTKGMTQAELCNWDDGENKKRTFYFLAKGDNYVVVINANNSCESYKRDWFEITPQSFEFI